MHNPLLLQVTRILIGILSVICPLGSIAASDSLIPQNEPVPAGGSYDLVVFGGSSAGVSAAVAAGREGQKVLLLEPSYLIGGLTTGGLTKTDMGRREAIGGFAKEFYNDVLAYYQKTYGSNSLQVTQCNQGYYFEPQVALELFLGKLVAAHVTVELRERLVAVDVDKQRITSITTKNYKTGKERRWTGKMFIDATYEGDLMAKAGVMYRVGREARCEFNEPFAGMNAGPEQYLGTGDHRVQAYNIRGNLTANPDNRAPFPKPETYYPQAADNYVKQIKARNIQSLKEFMPYERFAYVNGHFDSNSGDFPGANAGYIEGDYEARERIAQNIRDYWLSIWWRFQNDPDLPAAFLKDMQNFGVPNDIYAESGNITPQIYVRTGRRMLGRYFMTQNDLTDARFKEDAICMGNYGLDCHWIQDIRSDEGRVLEGTYSASTDLYDIPYGSILPYGVKNLLVVCAVSASNVAYSSLRMEPIYMMLGQAGGLAAFLANRDGKATQDIPVNELQDMLRKDHVPLEPTYRPVIDLKVNTPPPYRVGEPIEFELVKKDTRNPLTQIVWNFDGSGSVQADGEKAVYVFKYPVKAQVALAAKDAKGIPTHTKFVDLQIGDHPDPIVEVSLKNAKRTGHWNVDRGMQMEYYYRMGQVDIPPAGDEPGSEIKEPRGDGQCRAVYTARLPRSGRYLVAFSFPTTSTQATNVPVTVTHADGETMLIINQRVPSLLAYRPLGEFRFEKNKPAAVTVANDGTNGRTAIDAVRWIWMGE